MPNPDLDFSNNGQWFNNPTETLFNKLKWKHSKWITPTYDEFRNVYLGTFSLFSIVWTLMNPTSINRDSHFSNITIQELLAESGLNEAFEENYWPCTLDADNNRRMTIKNASIYNASMDMEEPVFSEVSFKNIVVTLEYGDGNELKLYLDPNSGSGTVNLPAFGPIFQAYGFNDMHNLNANDQLGTEQLLNYYILCGHKLIYIPIRFNFIFGYAGDDFEPVGIIDACKFYPIMGFGSIYHEVTHSLNNIS